MAVVIKGSGSIEGTSGLEMGANGTTEIRGQVNVAVGSSVAGVSTATNFTPSEVPTAHRNKVINGAMQVSQRNGTSAIQLAAVEYYIVDRFKSDTGSSYDLKADGSQSTDVPAGKGFATSLKIAADGTNTPTAGQNGGFSTFIEGQDLQDFCFGSSEAKPLTLSFWAKSGSQNSGHTYGLMLGAWLGGTRNCQTKGFTVTSSWQKFTMTFAATGTAVSGSTIDNNTSSGGQIYWSLVCHSDDQKDYSTWTADSGLRGQSSQDNFNDHASNEFYVTGVQLEIGEQATAYEHRTYRDELFRCQRYYQRCGLQMLWAGRGNGSSTFVFGVPLAAPLRASPTVTMSGTMKVFEHDASSESTTTPTAGYGYELGAAAIALSQAGHSGLTDDRVINGYIHGTGSYLGLDAEL